MSQIGPVPERRCSFCRLPFVPRRNDQRYCRPSHRKDAHRLRRRESNAPELPTPRYRDQELLAEVREYREAARLPACSEDPTLRAVAAVREADEQIRRWTERRELRRKKLEAMKPPEPRLLLRVQVVTDGHPLQQPRQSETRIGVACSSPDLAVVVTGRPHEAA